MFCTLSLVFLYCTFCKKPDNFEDFHMDGSIVIVGAGHGGGRVSQVLRECGWTGHIDLVGNEAHPPYERPPLSKEVLTGHKQPHNCYLSPTPDADPLLRRHVAAATGLNTQTRTLELDNGTVLPYRALLLATGGQPRSLQVPGADLPGVMALRTLDDAQRLQPHLGAGKQLLVVGGGFIGLEVAASARQSHAEVILVEGGPRLMGRAVPAEVAEQALELHRARGVDVRLGVVPARFDPAGQRILVTLTDGSTFNVDAVVVGIGIEPATHLAKEAGLKVGRGIVVDAELRTSDPHVWAIGDVAEFPSAVSGQHVRQETWLNAETQARVAATNMVGGHHPYRQCPWFWSDQYDCQLQVTGEPQLGAQTVVRPLAEGDFLAFYLDAGDRLVGMSGWGQTSRVSKEFKLARTLVERGVVASPQALANPDTKLKSLLSGS
jgi:3-phenylpropionate/trans-cinnamate dioxygenase ferredoxin reductase component